MTNLASDSLPATAGLRVHIFDGARDTIGEPVDLSSWPAFVAVIVEALAIEVPSTGDYNEDKKALPAICAITLKPGTTRANSNIEHVTACLLDFDHVGDVDAVLSRLAGLNFIAYATPGDQGAGAAERRIRVCVELDRPLLPREVAPFRRSLSAEIGAELDGSTVDPARLSFVGKIAGTPDRQYWTGDGYPCPVDDLLAITPVPRRPEPELAARADDRELTDGERAILDQIADVLSLHYVPGTPDCPSNTHRFSRALAGWMRHLGLPISAAEYLILECLPTSNPEQKAKNIAWAFDVAERPDGWRVVEDCMASEREALAQLDALGAQLAVERSLGGWREHIARCYPGDSFEQKLGARNVALGREPAANDTEPSEPTAAPPSTDLRTDLGNARRLVRMAGAELRYCAARGVWLTWDGTRWRDDETGEVMRRAKAAAESLWDEARALSDDDARKTAFQWAFKCQSRNAIANAIELAKTEAGIAVSVSELDSDPWLLNVTNGTLNLHTGELLPPEPALLMTKCCAAPYVAGARSGLWEAFIHRTLGGDEALIRYVQRALGYALFGAWREKAFWFGHGPPDGGKSTLFAAVARVLGDYAIVADAETWMVHRNTGGNRGDLVRLLGARLVMTSEIREGMRVDERLVKGVTGGDAIVAAAKYEGEIEFRPTFKLWWFANDAPTIRDDDEGMWSRARVVPFTNPVPKADQIRDLVDQLTAPEHAPGVLAWLVEGCLAWQRDGIGTCPAVEAGTKSYRSSMNRAAAFLEECVELTRNADDRVPRSVLREAYDAWCKRNGVKNPLTAEALASRLKALGVESEENKTPIAAAKPVGGALARFTGEPKRDRHWIGVRLVG